MNIWKMLGFGSTETSQNEEKSRKSKFLEFFDFKPEPELLGDLHYQAEILWRLVLMARKLKETAKSKVSDPSSYPLAYRCQNSDYRDAVKLAGHFCQDLGDIPLHWAALDNYIEKKRSRGMRSHRAFTEPLALN